MICTLAWLDENPPTPIGDALPGAVLDLMPDSLGAVEFILWAITLHDSTLAGTTPAKPATDRLTRLWR